MTRSQTIDSMAEAICDYTVRFANRRSPLIAHNVGARGKQFRGQINEVNVVLCRNVAYCANQEQPFVNKLHRDLPENRYLSCQARLMNNRSYFRLIGSYSGLIDSFSLALAIARRSIINNHITKVNNSIKLFILNKEFARARVIGTLIAFTQATGDGMRQASLFMHFSLNRTLVLIHAFQFLQNYEIIIKYR